MRAANFERRRAAYLSDGIDATVLEIIVPIFASRLTAYSEIRRTSDDTLFIPYDDYAQDTEGFARRIMGWLGIEAPDETIAHLVELSKPIQKDVDASRHQRSGRSGQFREELKPETVERLNQIFGEALDDWGFER